MEHSALHSTIRTTSSLLEKKSSPTEILHN